MRKDLILEINRECVNGCFFSSPSHETLSAKEVIFYDCINGSDSVLPANLLSLSVRPAVVGDAHFIDPGSSPRNLRDKLRFDTEPVLLDCDAIQVFAPKNFITRLHIGEVQVSKHVREQCEKSVSHHVPKVNHTMSSAA